MRAGHVVWAAFLTAAGLGAGCAQVLGFDGDFHKADGGLGGSSTATTTTTGTSMGGGGSGGRSGGCANDAACDDGNPCTDDTCGPGGACVHASSKAGIGCQDAAGHTGTCDGAGHCTVACTASADCMSTNPCVTPACDTTVGKCTFPALPDGTPTPGVQQTPGDCHQHQCMNGTDTNVEDDTDVPMKGDCATGMCNGGVASASPKATDTACTTFMGSMPGYCDGSGDCVECVNDGECPGPTTDCAHPACVSHACTKAFTPMGTATTTSPPQVPGDCQTVQCDGGGGTFLKYDPTDAKDDGNACTTDTCTSPGTTVHTDVANGTPCGTGGTLSCLNGTCAGCTTDSQCPAPSCNSAVLTYGQHCSMGMCVAPNPATLSCSPYLCSNGACGTKCSADTDCVVGDYCTGTNGTCQTKLLQGTVCSANHQCSSNFCVDGVCCNLACSGTCQACSSAKKGGTSVDGICGSIKAGSDPDNECADQGAASCGTDGVCDGSGACQFYANTTQCAAASCSGSTFITARSCDGMGMCGLAAQGPCAGNFACQSTTACYTACGNASGTGDSHCASGYYCDGVGAGACQAQKATGATCNRGAECLSGTCGGGHLCQ